MQPMALLAIKCFFFSFGRIRTLLIRAICWVYKATIHTSHPICKITDLTKMMENDTGLNNSQNHRRYSCNVGKCLKVTKIWSKFI